MLPRRNDGTLRGIARQAIGGRFVVGRTRDRRKAHCDGSFTRSFHLSKPYRRGDRTTSTETGHLPIRSKSYPEGYEHAEFVVNMEPMEFAARYPALDWDLSGAHKTVNADVRRSYDGCSVKFHRLGLAEVIALEKGEEPFELPRQPKLTPRTAPDPPPGPAALL